MPFIVICVTATKSYYDAFKINVYVLDCCSNHVGD